MNFTPEMVHLGIFLMAKEAALTGTYPPSLLLNTTLKYSGLPVKLFK